MANQLQWLNSLSKRPSLESAVTEVVNEVKDAVSGSLDLGIIFISSAYASEYSRLVPLILEQLPIKVLIGCGGGGVVGTNSHNQALEIEAEPALSLSVANLPGVEIKPFHLYGNQLPDLDSSPNAWAELVGIEPEKQPDFILLADPFSAGINDLLEGLDFAYPGTAKVGGLASGNAMAAQNGLFYHCENQDSGSHLYREGCVGIGLSGNIKLDTIVAQGCRPIGSLYQVTKGDRNLILEVTEADNLNIASKSSDSLPPLEALQELIQSLSEEDRKLAQQSLFIGIAMDEFKIELQQGDFLIRNLIGVDPKQGIIAIGDRVRPGQRIQFHLRDSRTSAEDLELLLKDYQGESNLSSVVGALMFACLGRGAGLYKETNFDSGLFRSYLPDVPLGGFFCGGEIGPVGGKTFLHGYTSVFAILRQGD